MNKLQVIASFKIHEGKLDAFKALAAQMLKAVKENEPGTTQYDAFFNADQTECVALETYTDSAAVFAHLADVGAMLEKLLELAEMNLQVFGSPSEELIAASVAMNPKRYSFFQGL
jgi:quinol monooxygenase YgiN